MPEKDSRPRFIFITPCVVEDFFAPVRRGAGDAAAALHVDYEFTGTDEVDIPAQVELVRQAVADGYDGIALSICHPSAFNEVVAEALEVGIPVVAFNIDDRSGSNRRLAGISQDFRKAGRTVAHLLTARASGRRRVLVTKHSEGVTALEERIAGIEEVLGTAGIHTTVIVSGMFPAQAQSAVAEALASGSFAGVVGTGQADTEGAGAAVEQLPLGERIPVAGFDLSPEILRLIRDRIVLGTVDQQPYLQGFYPLTQLVHCVRFGLAPSDMDTGAALVTAANVEMVATLCTRGYR